MKSPRARKRYLIERTLVLLMVCTAASVAQVTSTELTKSTCGKEEVKTDADVIDGQTDSQASTTKARIVFIEDFRGDRPGHKCLGCSFPLSFALDGDWVAATKGFSHSVVSIEPGVHHLCSALRKDKNEMPMLLNFTAKAGETYYIVAIPQLEFNMFIERFYVDNQDEGAYLTSISKTTKLKLK